MNQRFDLVTVEAFHGAAAFFGSTELQGFADLFNHVFCLVVIEVVFAPEFRSLEGDLG